MDSMVEDKKNNTKETENIESPAIANTSSRTRKRSMAANETPTIQRRSSRIKLSNDEQQNGTVSFTSPSPVGNTLSKTRKRPMAVNGTPTTLRRSTRIRLSDYSKVSSRAPGHTDADVSRSDSSSRQKVHQAIGDSSSRDKPEEKDKPSKSFGFLGLGNVGMRIANRMLTAGCKLYVWNRSSDKCLKLEEKGAEVCGNPKEVVNNADITFCCVGDRDRLKRMLFGYEGVLQALDASKAFIEMSEADAKLSKLISEFVVSVGAKFLEVRLQGTISDAENGSLVLTAAGDHMLFNDCLLYFKTFSKESIFIGNEVGKAALLNIFVNSAHAQVSDAAAETCAFAETLGFNRSDFNEAVKATTLAICPYALATATKLNSNDFNNADRTVKHLDKNLALFQDLAASNNCLKPISASVNVNYRFSKKLDFSNYDSTVNFLSIKKY